MAGRGREETTGFLTASDRNVNLEKRWEESL